MILWRNNFVSPKLFHYNNFGDMMTYNETLEYIHSLGNFSMPAGLERIKLVLDVLGNPQKDLKAIHIAGTNGKGSVAAMLAQVLYSDC